MKREHGIVESIRSANLEIRIHQDPNDKHKVICVPWYKDHVTNEWYDGVAGPPTDKNSLEKALDTFTDDLE